MTVEGQPRSSAINDITRLPISNYVRIVYRFRDTDLWKNVKLFYTLEFDALVEGQSIRFRRKARGVANAR